MTSTFAPNTAASRIPARAGVRVCALAVVAMQMKQGGVVLPPRSPGPGRP